MQKIILTLRQWISCKITILLKKSIGFKVCFTLDIEVNVC